MARRLAALRARMAGDALDAVLFTSYHNINYYATSCTAPSAASTVSWSTPDDGRPRSRANIDGGQPWRRTLRRQHRLHRLAARQLLPRACRQLSREPRRVGRRVRPSDPASATPSWRPRCPACELVDISAPACGMRMIKSAEEIALIRNGRADRRHRRRAPARRDRRRRARARGRAALDAGDGARDRPHASRTPN